MLTGPDGVSIHRYIAPLPPPPPPPPPPAPSLVSRLQGQVNSAATHLGQDTAKLNADKLALKKAQLSPVASSGRAGWELNSDFGVQDLQNQVNADQSQVITDQNDLNTAKANLAAAQNAQTQADHYHPTAPSITVNDKVTRAIAPALGSAQGRVNADQTRVNNDQAALNATQTTLNNLNTTDAIGPGYTRRLNALGQQEAQQQNRLNLDQQHLAGDKAQVAGLSQVEYYEQSRTDWNTAASDYTSLQKARLLDSNGNLKSSATAEQRAAYDSYIAAIARANADDATINQDYSDLHTYGAQAGGGGTAAAVDTVNQALAPLGLTFKPQTVQAVGDAASADAAWNTANAEVQLDTADQNQATLKHRPGATASQLAAATLSVTQAEGILAQAQSYETKLTLQASIPTDDQAVLTARKAYLANPTTANWNALDAAQKTDAQAKYQFEVNQAAFLAATAQVILDPRLGPMTLDQQNLNTYSLCSVPGSLAQQALTRDTAAIEPQLLVTNELSSEAKLLSLNEKTWEDQNLYPPTSATPNDVQLASYVTSTAASGGSINTPRSDPVTIAQDKQQQEVAAYQLAWSDFQLTLPENLLNPQTQADQNTLESEWNTFASQRHLDLTDGQVAQQLANLQPGQKVDIQAGMSEITRDQSQEQQILADRPLLQQAWDGITGGNTGTNDFLNSKQQALKTLQSHRDSLSAEDFNAQYLKIMGNLSTQFDAQTQSQINDSDTWSTVQQVVEQIAETTAAIAAIGISGGLGAGPVAAMLWGAGASFATSQAFAAGQNIVTSAGGGNLDDNSQISLFTMATDDFGQGGVWGPRFKHYLGHAGVSAGVDAVESLGTAAGMGAGGAVVDQAGAWLKGLSPIESLGDRTIGSFASQAMSSVGLARTAARLGSLPLVSNIGNVGVASLIEGAGSGAAGMTVNQGIVGVSQVTATAGNVVYEESQHQLTSAQGDQEIGSTIRGAVFNVVTAPLVGGISGETPEGFWKQTGVNLAVNSTITFGSDYALGQPISASDLSSIALNTLSATQINGRSRGSPPEIRKSGEATVVENDSGPVDDGAVSLQGQESLRQRRLDLSERLPPLEPVRYEGQNWQFLLADHSGVALIRDGAQDRIVRAFDLTAYTALFEGRTWDISRSDSPNGLVLTDSSTGTVRELDVGQLPEVSDSITFVSSATADSAQEITKWRSVSVDPNDKLTPRRTLLRPADPLVLPLDRGVLRVTKVPYAELDAPVPVRLKGSEREGAFLLSRADDGRLIARRGEAEFTVSPEDLVGEYTQTPSSAFENVLLPSTLVAYWGPITGARPDTSASYRDVTAALNGSGIGTVPESQVVLTAGTGFDLMREQLAYIQALPSGTELLVRQWDVPDRGADDAPNREILRAVMDHAQTGAAVSLYVTAGKLPQDLVEKLTDAGVTIRATHGQVVHEKSVATSDTAFIHTASYAPQGSYRLEAAGRLSGELARLYFEWDSLSMRHGPIGQRRKLLAELAANGVAIDSPDVNVTYAARTYRALARGAQTSIELYGNELRDPEFTRLLIEKAQAGVQVKLFLSLRPAELLDPGSTKLLRTALEENPQLPLEVNILPSNPFRLHLNAVFADDVAAVGTLYPWSQGMDKLESPRGTEHLLVFGGEGAVRVRQQIDSLLGRLDAPRPYSLRPAPVPAASETLRLLKLGQLFDITDPTFQRIDAGTLAGSQALDWITRQYPVRNDGSTSPILYHGSDVSGMQELRVSQPHLRSQGQTFLYGDPGISATNDPAYAMVWGLKRAALDRNNPDHGLWVYADALGRNHFAMTESLLQTMQTSAAQASVYVLPDDGFKWFPRDATTMPEGWPEPLKIVAFEWRSRTNRTPLLEIKVTANDLPFDRLRIVADGTSPDDIWPPVSGLRAPGEPETA